MVSPTVPGVDVDQIVVTFSEKRPRKSWFLMGEVRLYLAELFTWSSSVKVAVNSARRIGEVLVCLSMVDAVLQIPASCAVGSRCGRGARWTWPLVIRAAELMLTRLALQEEVPWEQW